MASCLVLGPRLFAGDMLLHKRAQCRGVTWLALFALGLILFVPTISRTLASASATTGMNCSMHGGTPHHSHSPATPLTLDACGYCTLMCHSPALTMGVTLTVPVLLVAPLAIRGSRQDTPLGVLLEQRSRGPPLI